MLSYPWRHMKLHFSVFRDFWKLILKKKQWWARKIIHYLCEGRIEKSVPWDHRLSSLGKPRDAKRRSSGRIFLSYPHIHDRLLYFASRSILNHMVAQMLTYLSCGGVPITKGKICSPNVFSNIGGVNQSHEQRYIIDRRYSIQSVTRQR